MVEHHHFHDSEETPPDGGSCTGKPTEWWFPEFEKSMSQTEKTLIVTLAQYAKRLCSICEIKDECLAYSLIHEPFGIWGGRDEQERLRIRTDKKIRTSYRTHAGLRPTKSNQMPYVQTYG